MSRASLSEQGGERKTPHLRVVHASISHFVSKKWQQFVKEKCVQEGKGPPGLVEASQLIPHSEMRGFVIQNPALKLLCDVICVLNRLLVTRFFFKIREIFKEALDIFLEVCL